jgi:hypothetical protein
LPLGSNKYYKKTFMRLQKKKKKPEGIEKEKKNLKPCTENFVSKGNWVITLKVSLDYS